MARRHGVRIVESFEVRRELGALIVDGKEVSPARVMVSAYVAGDVHTFRTAKDAKSFASAHPGKAGYIGSVDYPIR